MKKSIFRLPTLAFITLVVYLSISCKKNQEVVLTTPAQNVGNWKLISFQQSPSYNGRSDLLAYYDTLVGKQNQCYSGIVYNFDATGVIKLTYPSSTCVQGSNFTYFDEGDKWSTDANANTLIIDNERRRTFDMKISNNVMTLVYQSTSNISGKDVTTVYTADFKKQ